jgi:acetyltransferase
MPVKNPLDFWPAMEKNGPVPTYREALAALHQDPQVDGIIVHLFAGFGVWFLDMKEVLLGIRGPRKPILFWVMGHDKGFQATRMALEDEGWPVLTEIHRLVRVMAQLFKTREITGSTLGTKEIKFPPGPEKKPAAPRNSDTPILDEYQSKQWLRSIGLAVVADEPVRHLTEALTAAEKLGYPVVLKGIQEGKVHKTEAGLVRLNLRNPEELSRAFMEMGKGDSGLGHFLIQPMLKGGAELIAGVIRDPQFGPAVMLGLGGVWAEVYKDVVFRLAPVTAGDVLQMVESLRGKALLKGFRNSTPVDLELLAEWLIGLGQMALSDGRIREIDVNPLLVVEGKPVAVDASIILGEG